MYSIPIILLHVTVATVLFKSILITSLSLQSYHMTPEMM